MSLADIDALAAEAAARNARLGLTGLLLHQGGRFYGLLEGPERRVFARMEEIITDRRRFGLRILREEPIEARRFENWTFGMLPQTGATAGTPEDFILNLTRRR